MQYTNLLLDVDGTLVGTEFSVVGHDDRLKNYINTYMHHNGKIGLVTGRGEQYVSALYEFLGLNGVRIIEMGAGIIFPNNERIELTPLENKDEIIEFIKKRELFRTFRLEPKSFMLTLMQHEFPNHDVIALKKVYEEIKDQFQENFPNANITVDNHTIDIFNPKSDKGKAIEFYTKKLEVNLEKIAIAGDSRGDYPGFKVIGENNGLVCYVGLDENYAEELKKEFQNCLITKEKRSSGLVELLNNLLEH